MHDTPMTDHDGMTSILPNDSASTGTASRSPARTATCASCACRSASARRSSTASTTLVATRRKVKRGDDAVSQRRAVHVALSPIRTGFFKTCVTAEDGRDQVTGFQMAGEIIGLDGIVNDHHTCDAVALEDAEVCVMPFDRIEELSREVNGAAAPCAQDHEPRDRARARRDAAAGQHARRRAAGRLPAQPGAAAARARLLALRAGAAHDARGNRQLPRASSSRP